MAAALLGCPMQPSCHSSRHTPVLARKALQSQRKPAQARCISAHLLAGWVGTEPLPLWPPLWLRTVLFRHYKRRQETGQLAVEALRGSIEGGGRAGVVGQ